MRPSALLILAALLLALVPSTAPAAAPPCLITEGAAIGAVRIGMPLSEALRLTGKPAGQVAGVGRDEIIYLFPGTLTQLTAVGGQVRRLATRHPTCVTGQGVRMGDSEAKIHAAYLRVLVVGSVRAEAGGLLRLVFPFNGIAFVLSAGRVSTFEVFRPEVPPGTAQVPPGSAAPVEGVKIRSLAGRTEGNTFVVSGQVANSGRPIAMFAQIVLLGGEGRRLAEDTVPLTPNPVGGGRVGTFEERLPLNDVVVRFVVTIRPMNRPTTVLAERSQDVKDVRQFAGVVDRLLEVTVLGATLDRLSGTVVAVTNRSPLRISGLVLEVEMSNTCSIQMVDGAVKTFVDQRQGTVRVGGLGPNARVEVPIDLASRGPCLGFGTTWSTTWRVVSVTVEPAG